MKNKNSIKLKQLYTRRKSTKPKVGVFKKIDITDKFLARLLEGKKERLYIIHICNEEVINPIDSTNIKNRKTRYE